jgi:methionyl-tRNA formyltransferase
MNTPSCLFIGDPNLGNAGAQLVIQSWPAAALRVWQLGDEAGAAELRRVLRSRPWDLVISFYSDFILHFRDLQSVALPLNIHPALPCVPGLGYDIVPLKEHHTHYGATLHRMEQQVDSGEIYDVLERPLAPATSQPLLRQLNQRAALDLLARWVPRLAAARDHEARVTRLRAALPEPLQWGCRRMSRAELADSGGCRLTHTPEENRLVAVHGRAG